MCSVTAVRASTGFTAACARGRTWEPADEQRAEPHEAAEAAPGRVGRQGRADQVRSVRLGEAAGGQRRADLRGHTNVGPGGVRRAATIRPATPRRWRECDMWCGGTGTCVGRTVTSRGSSNSDLPHACATQRAHIVSVRLPTTGPRTRPEPRARAHSGWRRLGAGRGNVRTPWPRRQHLRRCTPRRQSCSPQTQQFCGHEHARKDSTAPPTAAVGDSRVERASATCTTRELGGSGGWR